MSSRVRLLRTDCLRYRRRPFVLSEADFSFAIVGQVHRQVGALHLGHLLLQQDEALRLADRIAIMKDGVIEQLDTPANIVLHPATEFVHKFTEEVPREKVLKIESVMEPIEPSENIGDLQVSKDAIIETVAEAVLSESKAVSVVDTDNNVVGILHPSRVISVLFGGRADHPSQ